MSLCTEMTFPWSPLVEGTQEEREGKGKQRENRAEERQTNYMHMYVWINLPDLLKCFCMYFVFTDTSRCPGLSVSSPVIVTWLRSGSSVTGSHTGILLPLFLSTRWDKTRPATNSFTHTCVWKLAVVLETHITMSLTGSLLWLWCRQCSWHD